MSELKELVTTKRFDEIHEARQQVIQDERSLNEALATGRVDDRRARRLFQRSVDTFVRELECLLNPPDEDEPLEYWSDKDVGELRLSNGNVKQIEGLGQYLDLDEEIVIEVETIEEGRYFELGQPVVEQRAVQPSWRLLRGAFRVANAALTDLGMELSPDTEDDDKWSYREIKDVDDINPEDWNNLSVFDNTDGNGGGADT